MAREQRSQRGVVGLGGLGSGVQVEFARAAGELREEAGDGRGGHASGFAQAEDAVGKLHAAFFQKRERGAAERLENPRHRGAWAGLADEAHGAKAVIERDGERAAEDRGMEVQVRVAVPISRRKSKRAETRKLRLDLAPQRLRERGRKGVAQPGAIRLACVTKPARWARSMAALISGLRPKSSAVTMRCFNSRGARAGWAAQR